MADLTKGKYTMAQLEERYNHFMVPDFSIKVAGQEVAKSLKVHIDGVKVTTSLDAAGSLSFDVMGGYDVKARTFREDVKRTFMIGKQITAEIGYAGDITEVFKGFIYSISLNFTDSPSYSVTAMDVIRLMQDSDTKGMIYEKKTPVSIFKEIMEKYKAMCPNGDIHAAKSASKAGDPISQKTNDYDFVVNYLCKLEGRDFFVLDGKAYFLESGRKQSVVLKLEGGKHFLSLSNSQRYLYKSIQVMKVDKASKKSTVSYTMQVSGTNQKKVLSVPQTKNITLEADGKQEDAKRQAEKASMEEKRGSFTLSGSCLGIPFLVPGRALTIAKIDQGLDGDYAVTKVEHSIGSDGFTTSFDLGGRLS